MRGSLARLVTVVAVATGLLVLIGHGAHAAGLTTGWAGRLERHYAEMFTRADVIGVDLVDVGRALTALPPAER